MMSSTSSSDDERQTSVKKHQKKLNSSKKISKKKRKHSSSSTSSSESSSTSGSESDKRKSKSKKRSKHSKKKSRNKKFEKSRKSTPSSDEKNTVSPKPEPKLRIEVADSESETKMLNLRLKASISTSKPPESLKTNDNLPGSSVIENPPKADESLKNSTPDGQPSQTKTMKIKFCNIKYNDLAGDNSESEKESYRKINEKISTSTSKPSELPKTNDNLPGSSVIKNPPKADESLKNSTPGIFGIINFKRLKASISTSKPPESLKTNDNLPGSSVIENPPKADESLKNSTPGIFGRINFKRRVDINENDIHLFSRSVQPYKFLTICKNEKCDFAIQHDCYRLSSDIIGNAYRARDELGNIYNTLKVGIEKKCDYCSFVVIHKSCQKQPNYREMGMYTSVSTHTRVCSICNWQVVHSFRSGQNGRRCHWVTNKNNHECTCGCIEIRHDCGSPFKTM